MPAGKETVWNALGVGRVGDDPVHAAEFGLAEPGRRAVHVVVEGLALGGDPVYRGPEVDLVVRTQHGAMDAIAQLPDCGSIA